MPRLDRRPPESDIYSALDQEPTLVLETDTLTQEIDRILGYELDATLQTIFEDYSTQLPVNTTSIPIPFEMPSTLEHPLTETSNVKPTQELEDDERYTKKDIVIQAVAVTAILGSVMYWSDVAQNVAEESKAEPDIKVVAEALDPANSDSALIIEGGFNTVNADLPSEKLGPALQQIADGEIWSVQSNNASMNTEALLEKAVDLALSRGITSISIATYSMGDMRGTSLAEKIVKETDIPVENIINMSGPSGYDSLRQYRKNEMTGARTISKIFLGSANSTPFRWVSELYFYRDAFLKPEANPIEFITKNIPRLVNVIKGINKRFEQPYASNSSLLRQMDLIDSTHPAAKVQSIGEYEHENDEQITNFIYLGSTAYDAMVDQEAASQDFKEAAEKGGMPFFEYNIENVRHGDFYLEEAVAAYEEGAAIIAESVGPQTEENRSVHMLRDFEIYNMENFAVNAQNE